MVFEINIDMNNKTGIHYTDLSLTNALLIKDKQNKLALFAKDRFVFIVDHYTAVDSKNTAFKLYGKPYTVLNTKQGKLDFSAAYKQFTVPYKEAVTKLLWSNHPCFRKLLRKKVRRSLIMADAFLRFVTLGYLGINPGFIVRYDMPICPILTGAEEDFSSIIISPQFFDRLVRISNVSHIIIDFNAIWQETVIAATSSQLAVEGTENNPAGSTK